MQEEHTDATCGCWRGSLLPWELCRPLKTINKWINKNHFRGLFIVKNIDVALDWIRETHNSVDSASSTPPSLQSAESRRLCFVRNLSLGAFVLWIKAQSVPAPKQGPECDLDKRVRIASANLRGNGTQGRLFRAGVLRVCSSTVAPHFRGLKACSIICALVGKIALRLWSCALWFSFFLETSTSHVKPRTSMWEHFGFKLVLPAVRTHFHNACASSAQSPL